MPLYEYKCGQCNYHTEIVIYSITEVLTCPKCGNEMDRLPSHPAMVKMKGMGGYPSRRKEWKGTAPFTRKT